MFYDDEFCQRVEMWLRGQAHKWPEAKFNVFIGDPGRPFWTENTLVSLCTPIYELEFPEHIKKEYPGFHTGIVL